MAKEEGTGFFVGEVELTHQHARAPIDQLVVGIEARFIRLAVHRHGDRRVLVLHLEGA